jgi:pimeloyl-ACP methyl ester carboxylesterase
MPLAHPFSTSIVTSADGTQLAVHATDGPDSLPWVVLIASPSAALPFWRPHVEYLGSRFRFVTWDYRGLFRSRLPLDLGAFTMGDQQADLLAALDAVGARRCSVISWSIGAELALDFAADHLDRVAHVAMLNPVLPRKLAAALGMRSHRTLVPAILQLGRKVYPHLAPLQQRIGAWPESAAWMKRLGLAGATIDDEVYAEITAAFRTLDMAAYRSTIAAFEDYERPVPLEALSAPFLLVAGEDDRIGSLLDAKRAVRRLPYGELFVVKGGTHYTPIEFPELVNLRVEKFLDAHHGP